MIHTKPADHEGVIEFGPCPDGRIGCRGHGTATLDPSSDTIRKTILCGVCEAARYLEADDLSPATLRVIEDDRIYGMGAAA